MTTDDSKIFEAKESGADKGLLNLVRDIAATGLATFFLTEEGVKNFLKEKNLPKEFLGGILEGLSKKKEDFYGLLAKELGQVASKLDLGKELGRFLEHHRIHVKASFSFEPKSVAKSSQEVSFETKAESENPHEKA